MEERILWETERRMFLHRLVHYGGENRVHYEFQENSYYGSGEWMKFVFTGKRAIFLSEGNMNPSVDGWWEWYKNAKKEQLEEEGDQYLGEQPYWAPWTPGF